MEINCKPIQVELLSELVQAVAEGKREIIDEASAHAVAEVV